MGLWQRLSAHAKQDEVAILPYFSSVGAAQKKPAGAGSTMAGPSSIPAAIVVSNAKFCGILVFNAKFCGFLW